MRSGPSLATMLMKWVQSGPLRQWWIEPTGLHRLRFRMVESKPGNPLRSISESVELPLERLAADAETDHLWELMRKGIDKWEKLYHETL